MIGYLRGIFQSAEHSQMIVDVGGVGYSVQVSDALLKQFKTGQNVELYIYTHLRENALELFGFSSQWEKKVFLLLTSVSGIGPKTAVTILGSISSEQILSAVIRQDILSITSAPGIGKKTAERLILEISDKARKLYSERPLQHSSASALIAAPPVSETPESSPKKSKSKKSDSTAPVPPQGASYNESGFDIADLWNQALEALVGLGYRETEAIAAIRQASKSEGIDSLEKIIRSSLQLLSRVGGITK